jgi:drug/metabolite transporter (DMT)-like permease
MRTFNKIHVSLGGGGARDGPKEGNRVTTGRDGMQIRVERNIRTNGVLITAIVSISFAATFIRLAAAPAIAIAGYRMFFSTILLFPFVISSKSTVGELRGLRAGEVALLALSGLFLSIHFISWIASIFLTGVASSIVLVTTTPLFVTLYSILVLKERVPALFWIGLALAAIGAFTIGGGDIFEGGMRWKGDMLAVLGAFAAAGYFIIGSRLRKQLSLLAYVFPVYLIATIFIFAAAVSWDIPVTGYRGGMYLYSLLLAFVCQIMGHTLFNWALKHVRASVVTLGILGEPVGASVIAYLVIGETPLPREIAGGLFILAGLFCALYFRNGNDSV